MDSSSFWHLDLGNLLTIGTFALSAIAAYFSFAARLTGIESRLHDVDEEMKRQTQIMVDQAAQGERMNSMDKRLDELAARMLRLDTVR